MAVRHQRFALREVTFGGVPLPGATMDCWRDAAGISRWAARIVARTVPAATRGLLVGTRSDGSVVSGEVVVGGTHDAGGSRRETMIELHGEGPLHGVDDPA